MSQKQQINFLDQPVKEIRIGNQHQFSSSNCKNTSAVDNWKITKTIRKKKKKMLNHLDGAPKMPLTGYVRYMTGRRDAIRFKFPNKTAIEHTKMIAEEWHNLSKETKKPFLLDAENDKERYIIEMTAFLKQTKIKEIKTADPVPVALKCRSHFVYNYNSQDDYSTLQNRSYNVWKDCGPTQLVKLDNGSTEIAIFTEEFIKHNKANEMELKNCRKLNTDYEQQNSVLEKHNDTMRLAVENMNSKKNELNEKNRTLTQYYNKLKIKLIEAFSGLVIPDQQNVATADNIEKYMVELSTMASSNSHGPAALNKAKDIMRKLDLNISLLNPEYQIRF